MGEQHFCLRWNHHQSTLVKVFDALLQDESLVDVTLYAEGRAMRAHKVVLSACSSYFQEVFANHTSTHPVIILKDILYSELRALIDYMYRGEVSIGQQQLGSLIRAAESLQVKGLADGSGGGGVCGTQTASDTTSFSSQSLSSTFCGPSAAPSGATGQRIQQQQQQLYHQQYQQQLQRQVNGAISPSSSTAHSVPPIKRRRAVSPPSVTTPADGEGTQHQAPTLSSMLLATRHSSANDKPISAPSADTVVSAVNITPSGAEGACRENTGDMKTPGSGATSGGVEVVEPALVVDASMSASSPPTPPPVSVHVEDIDDQDADVSDALVVATGDASGGSEGRVSDGGIGDDCSPSGVGPGTLPNIPATITPVTANGPVPGAALFLPGRPESPTTPELDLSIRSGGPDYHGRPGFGPGVKLEEGVARSDGEQEGSEGEAAGPSGGLTTRLSTPGEPTTNATALLQHGLMKWPISENASSDSLAHSNETGTAQDALGWLVVPSASAGRRCGRGGDGGFICAQCGRQFRWKSNLSRHLRLECGVERKFQCLHCNYRFVHKHHLESHVNKRHNDSPCSVLAVSDVSSSHLN